MKIMILLITTLAFFGCDLGPDSPDTKSYTCPLDQEEIITANPGSTYNLDQVLSVDFRPLEPLAKTTESNEKLDKKGYKGKRSGYVKVNIPEDGTYVVWTTAKAWVRSLHEHRRSAYNGRRFCKYFRL